MFTALIAARWLRFCGSNEFISFLLHSFARRAKETKSKSVGEWVDGSVGEWCGRNFIALRPQVLARNPVCQYKDQDRAQIQCQCQCHCYIVHTNLNVDDDIPERKVHTAKRPIWMPHWAKSGISISF